MHALFRRFFYAPWTARLLGIMAVVYSAYYLYWRTGYSLNPNALFLAVPLLLAEFQGWFNFCLFLMMTWDTKPMPYGEVPQGRTVDILIPTYNEDLSILKMTILGAQNVRYPHKTWVLDDGRRPALRQICQQMGVEYLTRPDNKHHKAGNINAALEQTDGEFITIFDADHVPFPTFLDHTLGYFVDDKVAFVQTPQEFYNLDSAQHHINWQKKDTWHEQSMFYRIIQPGKNHWNAVFWCGSGSVMRRSALVSVGGIADETVTEDIHTSLRLHAHGWKSIYHDEVLCMGLAPQDFLAFTIQRLRWAQGAMQVLRRENPIFKRGLTLAQRLNYVASIFTYFEAFQRLIYTIAPATILVSALLPIHVGIVPFLVRFLPFFLIGQIANIALGRGQFKVLETDRYNVLKMITFIKASLVLVGFNPKSFQVTPKSASQKGIVMELLRPYYVIMALIVLGMLIGGLRLAGMFGPPDDPGAFWIAELWSGYNLWLMARSVHSTIQHITRRNTYRFPIHVPITIFYNNRSIKGITVNLHAQGIALLTEYVLPVQESVRIQIHLPQKIVSGSMLIHSNKQIEKTPFHAFRNIEGTIVNGGTFSADNLSGASALDEFLISIMNQQLQDSNHVYAPEPELVTQSA